jgi:hypothetical protein
MRASPALLLLDDAIAVATGDRGSGTQVAKEGDAGERPVALDGAGRDLEYLSDLLDGETAEVAEFDDPSLARIGGGEVGEGLIDGGDFVEAVGGDSEVVLHLHPMEAAGAALGVMLAGVVDEDLAHDMSSESDEVGAAVPVNVLAGEAEVGLVDEGSGLEGVVGALAPHISLGEAMQLRVDERKQTAGGGVVAVVHGFKELCDLAWG